MKKLRSINLNLLPVLHELLLEKNVSRASAKLNLSQSATSEALGKLRDLFEDPLLIRSGKNMTITPFAEELQKELEPLIADISDLFNRTEFDPSSADRSFIVSTADYVTEMIAPSLLPLLEREAPGIKIQFADVPSAGLNRIATGQINFALVPSGILDDQRMISTPVFRDNFVIIADKNNSIIKKGLTRKEYTSCKHVVFQPGPDIIQSFEVQTLLLLPEKPEIVARVPQFNLLPVMIQGTDYVAAVHSRLAEKFSEHYDINVFESPISYPPVTISALRNPAQDRDPAFSWLIEQITDVGQQLDAQNN